MHRGRILTISGSLVAAAVLIAAATLGQLPVAAGVLMTAAGTAGGLCLAGWAGSGRLLYRSELLRRRFA